MSEEPKTLYQIHNELHARIKELERAPQPWGDDVALMGDTAPTPTGHIDWLIGYLLTVRKRFGNTTVVFERLRWGASALWARHEHEARIVELEEAGRVLAEEVVESRKHLIRAPHPDNDAPPTSPYFELNTHARQYDDCNMADARRDTDANPTASAMVKAAQEKRT